MVTETHSIYSFTNLKKYMGCSIFSDDVERADPHIADLRILFSHTAYHPNY